MYFDNSVRSTTLANTLDSVSVSSLVDLDGRVDIGLGDGGRRPETVLWDKIEAELEIMTTEQASQRFQEPFNPN